MLDTGGKVLAQASAGYAVTSAMAGYAESEPADWWSAVTACTREAVHAAGAQPAAIGLSGQMHGLVLTSADGAALRPALLWPDSRAAGALRAYRLLGPAALARLANPLAPGMAGPLLLWIAEHEPRTLRRRPLGAAAQGLAAGPPHRRVPRRAERCFGDLAVRRAG